MTTLQFKRAIDYVGGFDSAVYNIKHNLSPSLKPGEPLICSYKEDDETKYFLAIGADNGNVVIHPTFKDQEDFIYHIKRYAGVDFLTIISDNSDITISLDESTNKYTFKIKDDILNLNWKEL